MDNELESITLGRMLGTFGGVTKRMVKADWWD